MKFNPAIPIYLQIMDSLEKDIVTGTLHRGERIDSVRALADKFGVNLNTMQRACSELERQGILVTQRGIGRFVTEDDAVISSLKKAMTRQIVEEFKNGMKSIGHSNSDIVKIISEALKE
ncbi:predicted transcriptional regulator [Longilinea arvoryzae]|uniref:Predicted transcriptional regulator n=1 Tax=Longilinea arvoryzae TaxID=360412 RepID=A0A0S7BGS8_9CHLR|nr:GntR family transcriptional regulator [Longilinea arvoryzae]GAP13384.1 predicted transcriptional regulator [Longilinea arvoryzae]